MFTVSGSIEIQRPVSEVFRFAGDYRNDPRWRKGVSVVQVETPVVPGRGTKTTETMSLFGRTSVTVAEVVEYIECSRTAFRSLEGPVPCHGFRTFVPTERGTQFTYSLTLMPEGVMRLVQFILRPVFQWQVEGDLQRLKSELERVV